MSGSVDKDGPAPTYLQYDRKIRLLIGNDATTSTVAPAGSTIVQADDPKLALPPSQGGYSGSATKNSDGTYTLSPDSISVSSAKAQTTSTPAGGIDLSKLRITFTITRDSVGAPHLAVIRVYNLSSITTAKIQKEYNRVFLQVGYGNGPMSTIFNGTVIKSTRGAPIGAPNTQAFFLDRRESQTDTYLEFIATDGDAGFNKCVVSVTLEAGASAEDQLKAISKALEPYSVGMGYADLSQAQDLSLPRGIVLHGLARDLLDDFCKWSQTSWNIQDGKLEIVRKNSYIPGQAIVLTPSTGLLQTPRQTLEGIEFTCLLNPFLRVGRAVQIKSQIQQQQAPKPIADTSGGGLGAVDPIYNPLNPDGFYRLFYYQHVGDTRGNTWYTNAIGRDIAHDVPNPGASVIFGGAL